MDSPLETGGLWCPPKHGMELGRIFTDHNRYSHQNTNHQCWVCCCSDHAGLLAVMSWFAASRAVSRVQPALDTGTKQPETFRKHSQFIWHWNAEAWTEQRRLQWQWSDDATTPANSSTLNYLPSSMSREAACCWTWRKLLILYWLGLDTQWPGKVPRG